MCERKMRGGRGRVRDTDNADNKLQQQDGGREGERHSLVRIFCTRLVFHDPIAPCVPSASQRAPLPDRQAPELQYGEPALDLGKLPPSHAPTQANTPPPFIVPSPCSSALLSGANGCAADRCANSRFCAQISSSSRSPKNRVLASSLPADMLPPVFLLLLFLFFVLYILFCFFVFCCS